MEQGNGNVDAASVLVDRAGKIVEERFKQFLQDFDLPHLSNHGNGVDEGK